MRDELVDFLERAGIEQPLMRSRAVSLPCSCCFCEALFAAAELGEAFEVAAAVSIGFIQAATQGLLSVPTPSTFTITRSPGCERTDAGRRAGRDDVAGLRACRSA